MIRRDCRFEGDFLQVQMFGRKSAPVLDRPTWSQLTSSDLQQGFRIAPDPTLEVSPGYAGFGRNIGKHANRRIEQSNELSFVRRESDIRDAVESLQRVR